MLSSVLHLYLLPAPLHNQVLIHFLLVPQHLFPYISSRSSYIILVCLCFFSPNLPPPAMPHLSLWWQGVESCSPDTCDELEATENKVPLIAAITRLVNKRGLLLIYRWPGFK